MKNGQKLKVALVFDDTLDSSDGVAQYVKTLGGWLSSQGHDIKYLVGQTKLSEWHGSKVYSLSKNIRVSFNGNRLSIPLPANSQRIRRILANENFDVIHVMVPYSPFMAAKVINHAPRNTAIVGTFHIFPSGKLSVIGSHLLKIALFRSLQRFDEICSVSSVAADFAKSAFAIKSQVVPNVIDINRFKTDIYGLKRPKYILFLGRLVDRKGPSYLIEAFAKLTLKDIKLVIAGDGPLRTKLHEQTSRHGLDGRVEFLGYINESDKPGLLAAASVACFPSLYGESFGIVLIEAMAAGNGVILAGDNPGYRSVLQDQPMMLIDPSDTDEFARRLHKLLTDTQVISKLHNWQQSEVNQYDVARVGPQILQMYARQIARLGKTSNNKTHGKP